MVGEGGLRGIGSICQFGPSSIVDNVHQSRPLRRALSQVPQGRYPPNESIET